MKEYNLRDLSLLITKGTTPSSLGFSFTDKGINFIKIESIDSSGRFIKNKFAHIDENSNESLKRSQLQENDILFSIAGALGRTALVTKDVLPANTNQALSIIRLKNIVNKKYIFWVLNSSLIKKQLSKQKQGVAQLNLSLQNIGDLKIPIPSLPEQERIAGELDVVCGTMEKQKKQLELCDTLIKSKFNEMFGEQNFEKYSIKKIIDNNIYKIKNKFSNNDVIKYIDISSIDKSQQIITGSKKFNVSDAPSRAQYVLKQDDILISTVRPNLRNVAIVKTEDINLIGSTGFCVLRCSNQVIKEYLFYIVSSEKFANKLMNVVKGANYPAVSDEDVKNIQIPLPPLPLQQKFADFVNEVEQNKAKIKQSLNETETLYKALMQKYFDKGENV